MSDGEPEMAAIVEAALPGQEFDFEEWRRIQDWRRAEIDPLVETDERTVLTLGSYRGDQHITLRAVQHELSVRRPRTRAVVLGDTRPLDVGDDGFTAGQPPGEEDPLTFRIKLLALAEAVDTIACILEDETGGEQLELERISEPGLFGKSHVFPRGYPTIDPTNWRTLSQVYRVAEAIYRAEDIGDEQTEQVLRRVVENARARGFDTNEADLCRHLRAAVGEPGDPENGADEGTETETDAGVDRYNWPQLAVFRSFEEAGRCHDWRDRGELRALIDDAL